MRISRLSMDGFGIFRDVEVTNLPPGISLFLGDNEAGKSTTLGFVHTVLFGYPDGRTREKAYLPLRGGQAGGRLELQTESAGLLTVERREGKKGGPVTITYPDGGADGYPALARLLSGTTRHLYRNLYAFSLGELQDLETVTDADVKDVIYGASLGASARSLPEARKRLDARMAELFRTSGSKPEINALLKDLEEVRDDLRTAGQGVKEYERLAGHLDVLERGIEERRSQLASQRERHERLKAHVGLWDDWMQLQDAEGRLSALPEVVESFPENGLTRLDELAGQMQTQQEELRSAEEDLREKRERLDRLVFDAALLANEAEIRVLVRGLVAFDKAITEIPRSEERLTSTRRQAKDVLTDFGGEWTEERVLALDRSPMIHGRIEEHRTALEETRRRLEKAKDTEDGLRAAPEEAAKEDAEAKQKVEKLEGNRTEVAAATLTALRERREQFSGALRDIPTVKLRHAAAVGALLDLLREINPAWSPETLGQFDGSLTSRQKVNEIDRRQSDSEAQERETRSACDRADAALIEAEQSLTRKATEAEEASADTFAPEAVRERKTLIRYLRDAGSRLETAQTELRARRQAIETLRPLPAGSSEGALGRRLRIFAMVATALALVVGPALWIAIGMEVGATAVAILLLAAMALFVLSRPSASVSGGQGAPDTPNDDQTIGRLEGGLEAIAAEIAELQEKLGATGEVNAARVDGLEDENAEHMRAAEHLVRLRDELEEIQKTRERAVAQKQAAVAAVEEVKTRCATEEAEWQAVARTLHLSPETSPRTAGLVFEKAETARAQARQVADLDTRLQDMRAASDEYLALMKSVPRLEPVAREGTDEQRLAALAEFLADMDREEKDARLLADARLAAERAARQLATANDKLEAASAEHRLAADADRKVRETWAAWLREHDMDETWSPDICLRLLPRAARLAELSSMHDETEKEVHQLSGEKDAFLNKLGALYRNLSRPDPQADKLAAEVHTLQSALEENTKQRTLHESLSGDIPELALRCDNRRARIEALTTEINTLVTSGGAGDEDEFRRRGRLFVERQALLQAITTHAGNVKKLSGHSDMAALREALADASLPVLRADLADAESEVREAGVRLENAQRERTQTDEQRKQLHDADAIAKLRAQEESLLEKLREGAVDWSRHAIARHLLATAKERFEKAHQPDVIRQASGYFSSITGGRYTQVFVPHDGDEEIEVIDAQGSRKSVGDLSRGTSEQLYLAIRFGYIASHSGTGERLPILMDDVLVNFDPTRASQAAVGILEMARTHQVLFFTCHPETVAIFQRHRKDAPVYRIGNEGISGPVALPLPTRETPPRPPPPATPGRAASGG